MEGQGEPKLGLWIPFVFLFLLYSYIKPTHHPPPPTLSPYSTTCDIITRSKKAAQNRGIRSLYTHSVIASK